MIYLFAGHSNSQPGAVSNAYKESDLTKELRNGIVAELKKLGASISVDNDNHTLAQVLAEKKPGNGSVLCDLHFNAGQPTANGVEVLVKENAGKNEKALANEIISFMSALGFRNRGVKTESQSQHRRLAVLHDGAGMSVLLEVGFITNKQDMQLYELQKTSIQKGLAKILYKYDELIK